MGPGVRYKNTGRCYGYQGNCCNGAVANDQQELWVLWVLWTLSWILGFSNQGCLAWCEHSQTFWTYIGQPTFISMSLFMSVILAFISRISFIGFKLIFIAITKVYEQLTTIIITILILRYSSNLTKNIQGLHTIPISQPKVLHASTTNRDITESSGSKVTLTPLTPLTITGQSMKTIKRGKHGIHTGRYLYHHQHYRKYHIWSGVYVFSTPETSILVHVAGHQVEVPRLDLGITSRLADVSSELPMITWVSRVDDASCYTSSSEPAEV